MFEIKRSNNIVLFRSESAVSLREAVTKAVQSRANLTGANLVGAHLTHANLAGANLADANLVYANLSGANLANANLARANLAEADLEEADLARANLAGANLTSAYLGGADLEGANLTDANLAGANLVGAYLACVNLEDAIFEPYSRTDDPVERARRYRERHPEVPVVDAIDSKILQLIESGAGSLNMSKWHSCETTHCLAGWAITLAGPAGKELEIKYGSRRAGAMIYRASVGDAPHFFATTERALEELRERVRREKGGEK